MKYFLHDTNAFSDEKITELFMYHGYEGLGLFYTILERIASQEKPIKTTVLKKQLQVGKRLEKCWSFMEETGMISSSNGETFNERILSYSEKYKIKKEKNRERVARFREQLIQIDGAMGYVTHYNDVTKHSSNGSKVKESKVNVLGSSAADAADKPKSFKQWEEGEFLGSIKECSEGYERDMLNAFYKYWSEKAATGKMRFQLEKTWETKKRLETWYRRQMEKK